MTQIYQTGMILSFLIILTSCNGQNGKTSQLHNNADTSRIGGPFENSEFTYYGIPASLNATDTSSGWKQDGQKILLTGIVYQQDGKTPAPDVMIYYYHTNTAGRYLHVPEEKRSMKANALGQTHGYIRGWVKTDHHGKYFIYTVKPGAYPTHDEPAHVHITIKEPSNLNEYYIDDFVFDDDKLLTTVRRKKMENRAGSGVLRMVTKGRLHIGERNILLGLNIPGYPKRTGHQTDSGRNIGEDVFSFMPYHAWGPDKGTTTCPICKYGWYNGILYFVGNDPNWSEINQWLIFLEAESRKREKYLQVYFIYGNTIGYERNARINKLQNLGRSLKLEKIALTFVPSFSDTESEVNASQINQSTGNTFIIYTRSRIVSKFVNVKPSDEMFELMRASLDNTRNEYFDLPQAGSKN